MQNYAPIVIPTLNRYKHFKRCIRSLQQCTHAEKTELYIALDYPNRYNQYDGYCKIKKYIHSMDGFKKVYCIQRTSNYGMPNNMLDARKRIFKKYDRVICSEDDNVFSRNFLEYVNKGLIQYEHEKDIFAICAYSYPITIPVWFKANHYFFSDFSAWGFGIWKDRYSELEKKYSLEFIEDYISQPRNALKILTKSKAIRVTGMLKMLDRGRPSGDSIVNTILFEEQKKCVFPTVSKVQNHGHDGSGIGCRKMQKQLYREQVMDTSKVFNYSNVDEKNQKWIDKELQKYFGVKMSTKVKIAYTYVKYLIRKKNYENSNASGL